MEIKSGQELMWDKKAESFEKKVSMRKGKDVEFVVNYLKEASILNKVNSIVDVGCGTGRYSLEFAKESSETVGIDISSEMLKYAENKTAHLDNIKFLKLDWNSVDFNNDNLKEKFDVAFASMVPVLNDIDSIRNFTKLSKKYCVINRFIKSENNIEKFFEKKSKDPHNDRTYIRNMFNILWDEGYNPEIKYYKTFEEFDLDLDEVIEYYANNNIINIQNIKNIFVDNKRISCKVESELVLLIWKV